VQSRSIGTCLCLIFPGQPCAKAGTTLCSMRPPSAP